MKKNFLLFLTLLFTTTLAFAQSKKPATKPKTTTAKPAAPGTKPYTPASTQTTQSSSSSATKTTTTTTPTTTVTTQPAAATEVTPEMQEQYDKLNATKPATNSSPSKTTKSQSSTTTTTNSNRNTGGSSETYKSRSTTTTAKAKPETAARRPSEESKFHIGLKGGVNLGTAAESGKFITEGADYQMGYHGGVVLNFGGKGVSFQPEILFSQLGYKASSSAASVSATINTVTVPLLLKFSLGGDTFRFFITAGGYGSYYLSGKTSATFAGQTQTQDITFESGDPRIEYGAAGGAGLQFGRSTKFFVEGRYNYGLGDNGTKSTTAPQTYSRTIMASAGVLIPL